MELVFERNGSKILKDVRVGSKRLGPYFQAGSGPPGTMKLITMKMISLLRVYDPEEWEVLSRG